MGSCFSKTSEPREPSNHPTRWKVTTSNLLPSCEPLRLLGEGTFGTVVLVRERSTKQLFAVKVMNKSQLVYESQLDNIVTERQVLREAGPHPFVVQCHSGFQTPQAVVLVLEYVCGGDMFDLLKRYGCLTEEQARFYLAEITVAVAELHSHDFVFRDLKLENILIDGDGHVRLTDFGLAGKFRSGDASEKAIFDISGTAIYQAPEMIKGEGHGRVVDWWALGVLAYVLMAGRPPFSSDSREELTRKIAEEELDLDNDDRLAEVSDTCKHFIRRLLDKNPATRLGHAGADAQDVQQHPFFEGIDWNDVENSKLTPPLQPALESKPDFSTAQDIKEAHKSLANKVLRKHKGGDTMLDEGEYKPIVVNKFPTSNRVSIGLDFSGRNKKQASKTWTGTHDDFGREISTQAEK